MKRILPILILISILTLPFTASAVDLQGVVTGITNAIWIIFAGLIIIMFVWAGIMFLTAVGNPEKLGKAKSAFMWGIVGVIVGIIAFSAHAIVNNFIGGGGGGAGP